MAKVNDLLVACVEEDDSMTDCAAMAENGDVGECFVEGGDDFEVDDSTLRMDLLDVKKSEASFSNSSRAGWSVFIIDRIMASDELAWQRE